uniref:Predicted abc-type amino acid transport system permease component n=1 Tax=uncultured alpha proteobacterium EBAC2C11 TaxID=295349 RepID=Q5UEZ1_9PROT|nr:predicted abc-type amino acid transport system permease component [uncultured alpha proteobacterium EBAC2C11]
MAELFMEILGKPHGIILFQLLAAARFTIYLSLIAFIGGGAVACIITLLRISKSPALQKVAALFIWIFQSVPLLMLLFLIGLGMPGLLDINIDPWTAATCALVLFTAAYLAEVWRGAVESVAKGQWEASYALNIKYSLLLRKVIFPQAIKFGIAPTVGFMVQIIKGTSLAYIIGFNDLMLAGKRWANAPVPGSEPFVVFPLMAVMYFCICYPLALFARKLEAKSLTKS